MAGNGGGAAGRRQAEQQGPQSGDRGVCFAEQRRLRVDAKATRRGVNCKMSMVKPRVTSKARIGSCVSQRDTRLHQGYSGTGGCAPAPCRKVWSELGALRAGGPGTRPLGSSHGNLELPKSLAKSGEGRRRGKRGKEMNARVEYPGEAGQGSSNSA